MLDNSLVRKLSFWHIWALGVGAVVGDGIFLLISQGAQAAGPSAAVGYFVGGLFIMAICMAISELAVGMPTAGSLHTWSARVLGAKYGFIAGMSEIAMNIIFLGAVSIALGAFSNYYFQFGDNAQTSSIIWAVILLTVIIIIALSGGEVTGKAQLILVIVLVVVMLGFGVSGVLSGRIDPSNYTPFTPFGIKGVWAALGMGIYAYMGPLALLTTGGECKKINDLPKAMFWAFITTLILYVSAMFIMMGLVNYTTYENLESPFVSAAVVVFGNAGGLIINTAAWIAAFTCLIAEVFAASRLLYGMAKEHVVPATFGKLSKTKVPYVGILFAYVIALGIIALGNIGAAGGVYLIIAMLGSICGVVCFTISLVSSYKYKDKFPEEWKGLSWHLPSRNIVMVIAFIGVAILFYGLFVSSPISMLYGAIVIALMLVFFRLYSVTNIRKMQAQSSKENSQI